MKGKDEGGRMKDERKAKSERDEFFLFLPPSAFILPPCFSVVAAR